MRKLFSGLVLLNIGLLIGLFVRDAIAARNSAGTMSAVNGPYTPNSVINSSAINARFADIESEITNSLSRDAKGGARASIRGIDGTVAAPAFSFTSETGSGLYRIGASDLGVAIAGAKRLELTSALFTVSASLGVGVTPAFPLDVQYTNSAGGVAETGFQLSNTTTTNSTQLRLKGSHDWSVMAVGSTGSPASGFAIVDNTNAVTPLSITSGDGVVIGSGGTAISGSFAASAAWTPGSIASGSSNGTSIVVTGAALGSPCVIGTPTPNPNLVLTCYVTANSCNILLGNPSAGALTGSAGTYQCRVWNP